MKVSGAVPDTIVAAASPADGAATADTEAPDATLATTTGAAAAGTALEADGATAGAGAP